MTFRIRHRFPAVVAGIAGLFLTIPTGCSSGSSGTVATPGASSGSSGGSSSGSGNPAGSGSGAFDEGGLSGSSGSGSGAPGGSSGGSSPDSGAPSTAPLDGAADADAAANITDMEAGPAADGYAGSGGDAAVPLNPSLLSDCTGTAPIVCTIPTPNGNYDVTAEIGSSTAASTTRTQAETWRIEQQPTMSAAGIFSQITFTVNVRAEMHGTYSAPGGVLNLLFDGAAPALHGLGFAPAPGAVTVFLAGDSTVCDWDPSASNAITPPTPSIERGWAQELSQYLRPGVAVANYAVSGQTAAGFYGSYFPPARAAMKAGDYLFIQFGHNDQKNAANIASYKSDLTNYINDARSKMVTPVVFTPVARGTGTNFAGLDQQARDVAAAQKVALIDLTNLSWAYYMTLVDKTVLFVPGQQTHFSESGATQVAGIVAQALKTSGLGLATFIK
ncbi:MAG: GDSL-type esterase/lipase family protein [Myxococcota bacterium]|nr:GDSL-type esterase/lipase family protein [Myxococcota bacterium]